MVATPGPKRPSRPAGIDRNAARASLDVINSILASCKKTGTVAGPGRAAVTFENDGTVSKVDILGKPYVGTPEGTCVASRLRKAKVAPFHGAAVTIDYGFTIRK